MYFGELGVDVLRTGWTFAERRRMFDLRDEDTAGVEVAREFRPGSTETLVSPASGGGDE